MISIICELIESQLFCMFIAFITVEYVTFSTQVVNPSKWSEAVYKDYKHD